MATPSRDDGIRVLDDFTTEAISRTGESPPVVPSSGVNTGIDVAPESAFSAFESSVPAQQAAALRGLSTAQLLTLVQREGPKLNSQLLVVIHDIATERLGEDHVPFAGDAVELSRKVMMAAVAKSA